MRRFDINDWMFLIVFFGGVVLHSQQQPPCCFDISPLTRGASSSHGFVFMASRSRVRLRRGRAQRVDRVRLVLEYYSTLLKCALSVFSKSRPHRRWTWPDRNFLPLPPTRHDVRGSEQRRRHTCILPLADEIGMLFKIGARVSADHSLQLLDTSVLIVEDFTKGLDD
jgi:hypothetical protein